MPNELDPRIDQWYDHLDKGQRFYVIAIDEEQNTVEIQHFDGDLEEFSLDEWSDLHIELSVFMSSGLAEVSFTGFGGVRGSPFSSRCTVDWLTPTLRPTSTLVMPVALNLIAASISSARVLYLPVFFIASTPQRGVLMPGSQVTLISNRTAARSAPRCRAPGRVEIH